MTEETVYALVHDKYGDYTDRILELFVTGYPCRDAIDVLSFNSRKDTVKAVQAKVEQGGAQVYNYVGAYEVPFMGGMQMSHTEDMAFWFHNLETREATPSSSDGEASNAEPAEESAAETEVDTAAPEE